MSVIIITIYTITIITIIMITIIVIIIIIIETIKMMMMMMMMIYIYIYNNNKVGTLEYQQENWKNITNRWQKRINNGMQPVKCQFQADAINDGQLTIVRIVSLGARITIMMIIEGSLEVKLPTIWTDEKQSRAEAERRERLEERRSEKRKSQKKEDADARKGRKVAKHCVFPMIWGSGGSKSRLAKAAGAEPAGQMRDEKAHAVVARSTFRSQNVQNTPASDHFWKLRCRKSARRCGAKHISKSKCTKHLSSGPLLEVEMSKKCTPLWREAHFQVKMLKTLGVRTTFGSCDVEKVHAVVARSTFRSQKC